MRLDDLMEEPAFSSLNPYPSTVGALLDATRSLRLVALRFAVNPVYAALIQKAGGSSFSPINALVYFAQILEETASFPYWHHLPESLDPAETFLCNNDDPQAGPAKFVLQSVEWKRPSKQLAAELKLAGRPESLFGPAMQQQQAGGPAVHRAGPAGAASKRDAGGPLDDGTVRLWRFSHGRVVSGFHR